MDLTNFGPYLQVLLCHSDFGTKTRFQKAMVFKKNINMCAPIKMAMLKVLSKD
jgi:hypothetical protein